MPDLGNMREEVLSWLDGQPYLQELIEYVNLPSRSHRPEEVQTASRFAMDLMARSGLRNIRAIPTEGNPVLFGEVGMGERSVLIYGHYDVQPEGDPALWNSPPFTAELRGDKLFGRGTADNKGQHYAHLLALRYLRENDPGVFEGVRVKFILDGDEERGSFTLPSVLSADPELFRADFVYASDGPSLVTDRPTIVGAVRGILDFQLVVRNSSTDLHSGNFGGIARSATRDLVALLESMVDPDGRVLIDGFYDDVDAPEEVEAGALGDIHPIVRRIIAERGITPAPVMDGLSHAFQNQLYPTLNINGLRAGGVYGERRTIIPTEAVVSVDCRLVPSMDPERVMRVIRAHVDSWSRDRGVRVEIDFGSPMKPTRSSLLSEWKDIVQHALTLGFGVEPVLVPRLGGSLPLQSFPEILGMDVVLVPYALPDENNHAPDENLDIPYFRSGVVSTAALIRSLSRGM